MKAIKPIAASIGIIILPALIIIALIADMGCTSFVTFLFWVVVILFLLTILLSWIGWSFYYFISHHE